MSKATFDRNTGSDLPNHRLSPAATVTTLSTTPAASAATPPDATESPILAWFARWRSIQPAKKRRSLLHEEAREAVIDRYGEINPRGLAGLDYAGDPAVHEMKRCLQELSPLETESSDLFSKILEMPVATPAEARAKLLIVMADLESVIKSNPGGHEEFAYEAMQDVANLLGEVRT
jgi:hypothetical protein